MKQTINGKQAMDRLDHLDACHEMGGGRNDAEDERERVGLLALHTSVGGRDGMEAIEALDHCPRCGHTTARTEFQLSRPRTCAVCWATDSTLIGRWHGGGAVRVRI